MTRLPLPGVRLEISLLAFGLALLGASNSMAANECGNTAAGPDVITCEADNAPPTDTANQASGITYTSSDGLTLNVDNAVITVIGGVRVSSSNSATLGVFVNGINFTSITSAAPFGYGLNADARGTGDAAATLTNGSITVGGDDAAGVVAQNFSNPASGGAMTATQAGGSVTTSGSDSFAVVAYTVGTGSATASKTGGAISTGGGGAAISAYGVGALILNAVNASQASASMSGGTMSTTGEDGVGIFAYSAGTGAVASTLTGGSITTTGDNSQGLVAQIANTASAATSSAVISGGSVTTSGTDSYGAHAYTAGLGAAAVSNSLGTISTGGAGGTGAGAYGMFALIDNAANASMATVDMNGGVITTTGFEGIGMLAFTEGTGAVASTLTAGSISTTGESSQGLVAHINNTASAATSSAVISGGSVTTSGTDSYGALAYTAGLGAAVVSNSAGAISTGGAGGTGAGAYGMFALIENAANASMASVDMNGGSITTTGLAGIGMLAYTDGAGAARAELTGGAINTSGGNAQGIVALIDNASSTAVASVTMSGGSIMASGADSHGIAVGNAGSGGRIAVINGGSVTSGSGNAAGIHLEGTGDGTVDIASGATIDSSGSGIAINDVDVADVTVTTSGTVTGDALLGLGDDVFNLGGGSFTGDVHGDGVVASLSDGQDGFNWTGGTWTGGFHGGNGSDTAQVSASGYDGTQILDGGDDASTADGFIDTLTMQGPTVALDGATTFNWEIMNFGASATATLTSIVTTTVNAACNGSTTLTGTSSAVNVIGCAGNDTISIAGAASVTNTVDGGAGNDVLSINTSGTVGGGVIGGSGNDTISWQAGALASVNGGDGSDSLEVGAAAYNGTQVLDGGDDATAADGFVDSLLVHGPAVALDGATVRNWETLGFDANATATLTNMVTVTVNAACNGSTTLTGNTTTVDVLGCAGNDSIAIAGAATVTSIVNGGAGNDTLTINTSGGVVGGVMGGAGNDAVTWTAGAVGMINGEEGSDSLEVVAAYNGTSILDGGDDASTADGFVDTLLIHGANLNLSGTTIRNWEVLNFDAAATVVLNNIATATVNVPCGGNATLAGNSTAVNVQGCASNDTINIVGASTVTNSVSGGAGNDTFLIDTAGGVGGAVQGGAGNDTIEWAGGSVGAINGGDGSDSVVVSSSGYVGNTVLDGGDNLSPADGSIDQLLLDGTTAATNGANIANWEAVTLSNSSLRILDGQLAVGVTGAAGSGLRLTNGSTLNLGPASVYGGDLAVAAGSRILMPGGGAGAYVFNGNLDSSGVLSTQDGVAGDAITINGNYTGGGRLLADVDYELRTADTMRITGTVSGQTSVLVEDVSSVGGVTPPDTPAPIMMIEAASAASNQFVLDPESSRQGIYAYRLTQFDDGNFYLSTSTVQGASVIEALGVGLMEMNELPTLQQRTGNRYWRDGSHAPDETGVWVSTSAGELAQNPSGSTTGSTYRHNSWAINIGGDKPLLNNVNGLLTAGLAGKFSEGRSRSASALFGSGAIDYRTTALAATLNWQARRGYYSDLQLQFSKTRSDLSLTGTPEAATSVDALGYAASVEFGYRGHRTWALTPQAQLQYSLTEHDALSFNGIAVDSGKVQSVVGRAGLALDREGRWRADNGKQQAIHAYALVDVLWELDGEVDLNATGTPVMSTPQRTWGRAGLGFTSELNDGYVSIFGEATYQQAFEDGANNSGMAGRVGVRFSW